MAHDPFSPKRLQDLSDADILALQKAYPGIKLQVSASQEIVPVNQPAQEIKDDWWEQNDGALWTEPEARPVSNFHFSWPSRCPQAYPAIVFVALVAYGFQGLGWLVTEVGQAVWYIGKRLHEDKWRIG